MASVSKPGSRRSSITGPRSTSRDGAGRVQWLARTALRLALGAPSGVEALSGVERASWLTRSTPWLAVVQEGQEVRAGEDADRMTPVKHQNSGRTLQSLSNAVDTLAQSYGGKRGLHHRADRLIEDLGMMEAPLQNLSVGDRPDHFGQGQRGFGLDHRQLGDPVFLEDLDGASDALRWMDMDQWRQAVPLLGQDRFGRLPSGPHEAVIGHPSVVVELGKVPPL